MNKTFSNKKPFTIVIILISTIAYCFFFPKPKYESPDILSTLEIPYRTRNWRGKDVVEELNFQDEKYNFISDVFARGYVNKYGESLLFFILDAGNFHHPKVCFGGSGFKIKELNDIEFELTNRKFKAHVLYAGKGRESKLVIYWICINGEMVDWTEQKIKQFWFSLFNKQKSGFMVRIDIPTREENIEQSLKLAQEFIRDISKKIPPEQSGYIFGKE